MTEDVKELRSRAVEAIEARQFDQAEKLAEQVRSLAPDAITSYELWDYLLGAPGHPADEEGRYRQRAEILQRMIELNPEDEQGVYAVCGYSSGLYEARASVLSYLCYKHDHSEQGFQRAMAAFDEAVKRRPTDGGLAADRVHSFLLGIERIKPPRDEGELPRFEQYSEGANAQYLSYLDQAVTANAEDPLEAHEFLVKKGKHLALLGQHPDALASFLEAMKLRPDYDPTRQDLADVHKSLGEYREALDVLSEIAPDTYSASVARLTTASIHALMGDKAAALQALRD